MAKTSHIDRDELEAAIDLAESEREYGNLSELCNAVSESMGNVSPKAVRDCIRDWSLPIKTKFDNRLSKTDSKGFNGRMRSVHTPAGKCPVKLSMDEITYASVDKWISKIESIGESAGVKYSRSAYIYYARQFCDYGSDNFNLVKQYINEMILENSTPQVDG